MRIQKLAFAHTNTSEPRGTKQNSYITCKKETIIKINWTNKKLKLTHKQKYGGKVHFKINSILETVHCEGHGYWRQF
jgi:hypothetical protein